MSNRYRHFKHCRGKSNANWLSIKRSQNYLAFDPAAQLEAAIHPLGLVSHERRAV